MIQVTEIQLKICHLLDNLAIEQRKKEFLASKLNLHPNTVDTQLKLLKARNIVAIEKDSQGRNHYFLKEEYRKKVCDLLCCEPPLLEE